MYPIEKVLNCLPNFRQHGDGIRTRCPVHNGASDDSLSITEGHEHSALLFCNAGCEVEAVVNALGLEMRDLFVHDELNDGATKRVFKTRSRESEDPTITTDELPSGTYWEFTSPSGEVLYMERHKCEYYRRVGDGLWKKGLGGMAQVLYNLPELIDGVRAGKTIYHLEGSKDAETARTRLSLVATTTGGSNSWRASYREHLRHTCATVLLGRGVHPKLVQHLLGHASITMTLDRYSHWIPSMGRHAADGMDEALG